VLEKRLHDNIQPEWRGDVWHFYTSDYVRPMHNLPEVTRSSVQSQDLKIKKLWGHSENAVKTQIWIAICTYLIVAILKKQLKLEQSLYEILQILSISVFDKTPANQLLTKQKLQIEENDDHNQLTLFDL